MDDEYKECLYRLSVNYYINSFISIYFIQAIHALNVALCWPNIMYTTLIFIKSLYLLPENGMLFLN